MKALIFGARFIGRHIVETLLEAEVVAFGRAVGAIQPAVIARPAVMVEDGLLIGSRADRSSPEHLLRLVDRRHQRVHFLARVVQRKRGARRARHTETCHQRHVAVVPGAHVHALAVQYRADVVRMHALQHERQDAARAVPMMRSPGIAATSGVA